MSYPFSLLGGYITHISLTGTLSEPQTYQKSHQNNLIFLATFIGKEGNSPLQNCLYQFLCSCPTLSASWEGTSPICNPTGLHQSPKSNKNTTKVTTFYLVTTFIGNQSPKCIMRSAVPLPCFFDVVKCKRVAGQRPQQRMKPCNRCCIIFGNKYWPITASPQLA